MKSLHINNMANSNCVSQNYYKVFKNRKEVDVKSEAFLANPKTLLLHFNEAAYTTTRTVNYTNILDYSTHFERLAFGALRKIYPGEWSSRDVNHFLPFKIKSNLSERIINSLTHAILSFHLSQTNQSIPDDQIDNLREISQRFQSLIATGQLTSEARIYLILSPILSSSTLSSNSSPTPPMVIPRENSNQNSVDNISVDNDFSALERKFEINSNAEDEILRRINKEIDIWVYIEPLPPRCPFASIELRKHPKRDHADLKSVEWVRNRQDLETLLLSRASLNINETILMDPITTEMYEGLSSNFFIVDKDGQIVTAEDENVLVGTIMKMILEICERLRIPLLRRPPSLSSLSSAKAAFISSTTRLLLPVDKVYYPEHENGEMIFELDKNNEILLRIQNELLDNLLSHSFKII